jgi:hypothetical protein
LRRLAVGDSRAQPWVRAAFKQNLNGAQIVFAHSHVERRAVINAALIGIGGFERLQSAGAKRCVDLLELFKLRALFGIQFYDLNERDYLT